MGIPSYFVHLVRNHRSIIKTYDRTSIKIDNLYLDCNSLIYNALNNIVYKNDHDFETKLLEAICIKLAEYINIISPKKKVFIAFDGVAPVAKLSQQKNRRYKSWFQAEVMREIYSTSNDTGPSWNSAAITPGTKFMDKLDECINKYFSNPKKFGTEEIIIATSKIAGEGEHKLYEYIRENPEYHRTTSTAIYGLDSDLIMLTLNHLEYAPRMYLFRETPYFIKTLDNTLVPNSNYLMDIPEFATRLVTELTNKSDLTGDVRTKIIKDYVFFCFLLGNDFMPHFPALNIRTRGIDVLLNIYNDINGDLKHFLIEDGAIVWKNLKLVFEYLAKNEHKLLTEEYKIRDKWERRKYQENTEEQKFINTPIFKRDMEKFINPREDGWQNRYYSSLFKIDINEDRQKQIAVNYLSILEWNFKYYTYGCPDWRFKYNYSYPPLFQDLIKYIPHFDTNFVETKEKNPITECVQLAYVLPRNSLKLIPGGKQGILLDRYNAYYKLDYKFEWSFCKYFWECHVLIPELEINELEKLLQTK